jgi:hypothetical protein
MEWSFPTSFLVFSFLEKIYKKSLPNKHIPIKKILKVKTKTSKKFIKKKKKNLKIEEVPPPAFGQGHGVIWPPPSAGLGGQRVWFTLGVV